MKKLIFVLFFSGCASVTPQDRAKMYQIFAKDHKFKCSAYHFDLSANLTPEVPEMTEVCSK